MLFSYFVVLTVEYRKRTRSGSRGMVLTRMFFVDDLILISRTPSRGMNTLLNLVDKYCREMGMALSVSITFVLSTGPTGRRWSVGTSGESLEETMVAKFLGINIQL